LTVPDSEKGEYSHRWPHLLPGGRAALFAIRTGSRDSRQQIAVVSIDTGEQRILRTGGTLPLYVPTGHLLYTLLGTVYAVEFDLQRLELVGSPQPVLQDVQFPRGSGDVRMALSGEGSLVYAPGAWRPPEAELVWVDRQGNVEPLLDSRQAYEGPMVSPDGRYLAAAILTSVEDADIWLYELERGTWSRLTLEGGVDPLWSPDGEAIVFTSDRNGPFELFRIPADGSGPAEQLTTGPTMDFPGSFTPDGGLLLFQRFLGANLDLFSLALAQEGPPKPLVATPALEAHPKLSPDGRWLAFVSAESRRPEVYVRPFPGPGAKIQVSTEGGNEPVWHPTGRELFYHNAPTLLSPGRRILSVSISTGPELSAERPRVVFETDFDITSEVGWHSFDISRDGERFLMVRRPPEARETRRLVYVPNWLEELELIFADSTGR